MPPRASNASSSTQRRRSGITQTQQSTQQPTQTQGGSDDDSDAPGAGSGLSSASLQIDGCAKQIVRLALALHNQRQPLRRQSELVQKIMKNVPRQWKHVLEAAQKYLRDVFGMELVELPVREKVTLTQRRNAAAGGEGSSSKAWILVSTLPQEYRLAAEEILIGGLEKEHAYMGFVTLVVSVIYLNGRALSGDELDKFLRKFNVDIEDPVLGKIDKVLEMMERHGYIVKVKDNSSGETMLEYHVGPRGKTEIGESGAMQLIKEMYSDQNPDEVEAAFKRSAGVDLNDKNNDADDDDDLDGTQPARTQRGGRKSTQGARGKKRSRRDQEEDDDDESD